MNNEERLKAIRHIKKIRNIYYGSLFPTLIYEPKAIFWAGGLIITGFIADISTIGIAAGFGAFALIRYKAPKQTFNERIYRLLASYEPICDALYYAVIDDIVKDKPSRQALDEWIDEEYTQVFNQSLIDNMTAGELAAKKALMDRISKMEDEQQ